MFLIAQVGLEVVLPALTVVGGLGAIIFAALKFNREDASAVVNQQSTLLKDMKELLTEKQNQLEDLRVERDRLSKQYDALVEAHRRCDDREKVLLGEVKSLHEQIIRREEEQRLDSR